MSAFPSHNRVLEAGGRKRQYFACLPAANKREKPPAVLMLHGAGDTARGAMHQTGWADKAGKEGFIAAFADALRPDPDARPSFRLNPQMWNDGSGYGYGCAEGVDDTAFISAVIDDLCGFFGADPGRIYLTGFSNGAAMAFRAAAELEGKIAAVAPVCGHFWSERPRPLERPPSLLHIAGGRDRMNPVRGGIIKAPWGGEVPRPPVADTLGQWARVCGCGTAPARARTDGRLRHAFFTGARGGASVEYIEALEMGHCWPGGVNLLDAAIAGPAAADFCATDAIWDFFRRCRLAPLVKPKVYVKM